MDPILEIKYQVGEAWKGTYNSATVYSNAAVVQDPTGLSVYRSLKDGNVGHALTNNDWWFCIIDMSSIKAEADRVVNIDNTVTANEEARVAAENARVVAETGRVNAEAARVTAEQNRASAESARISAEQTRDNQETQRINDESARVGREQTRISNEEARVLAHRHGLGSYE